MWRRCGLTLAIVFASTFLQCQQAPPTSAAPTDPKQQKPEPAPKPKGPTPEEKWLYPAQRVSADLEGYGANLKRDLHAVAFTSLGSYWWKQDRASAERWVYPAVDEITLVPQEESDADRNARLEAVRRVLAIVTPLDPLLRERLKDVVTSAAPRDSKDPFGLPRRWQAADAIVVAGEGGTSDQLARAIEESFEYGVTITTLDAIRNLYAQSPADAQRLFDTALSQVSRGGDDLYAFASLFQADAGVPPDWKRSIVTTLSLVFSNSDLDLNARCAWASEFVTTTQADGFDLSRVVSAAMSNCSGFSTDANIIRREDPQTSDDYLRVAAEAKLPATRYQMNFTAAEKAEEEAKKEDQPGPDDGPVKALRILDGMLPDERAVRPSEYKRRREDVAVRASLWTVHFSGCSAGLRVVDTSPRETILHVAAGVAEKIGSGACFVELMQTIVLRQIDRIPAEDPNDYIRVINLILRHGASGSAQYSLQTVLRAMDVWKERDPKTAPRGEAVYVAPWNKLYPLAIVQELFNIPPDTLRAIARGYFRNELLRADFELLIVKGFLARYEQDLQKQKAEKTEAAAN